MEDEMNTSEMIRMLAEENQTRKILEILNECKANGKTLEEAVEKVKALLA